jgi:hypothetical protein
MLQNPFFDPSISHSSRQLDNKVIAYDARAMARGIPNHQITSQEDSGGIGKVRRPQLMDRRPIAAVRQINRPQRERLKWRKGCQAQRKSLGEKSW